MAKYKILLVDDEQIYLEAHREEFEAIGYEVQTALTGKEAIAVAGNERFDIAYVDLVMPDTNSVDICKEIKKVYPETEVVLVSGHPEEILKYKAQFVNAGGREEILKKPLGDKELINMTEKIMKEKEGRG
ncbi:MAG: response regulator [Candidatus Scalindua sp.]|jgi:YesN/AraC family two-component response regulator|nr:response regulator [Candidatus Scalindua sp.]